MGGVSQFSAFKLANTRTCRMEQLGPVVDDITNQSIKLALLVMSVLLYPKFVVRLLAGTLCGSVSEDFSCTGVLRLKTVSRSNRSTGYQ